jgi:hypothetical protein
LGLRKAAHPIVKSPPKETKSAPKPRSLSAAATGWNSLTEPPGDSGKAQPFPDSAESGKAFGQGHEAHSPTAPGQNGAAGPGFSSVSLLDHHRGQCRWIVSDVWPVMYCGAPVVDSSSWCELHSTRVFNPRSQALGAKFRLKVWS